MTATDELFLRRQPTRRVHRILLGTIVLLAITGWISGLSRFAAPDSPDYRTATAGVHTVGQDLHAVATIEPVTRADVAFPVGGSVATIDVNVGDTVSAGQQLASLDPGPFEVTLHEKQAALDQAELTLERARNGEDVGGVGGAGGNVPSGSVAAAASAATTTTPDGTNRGRVPLGEAELAAAQQALLDAKRAVDAAMGGALTALASASQICAALDSPPTTDATATTEPPTSTSTTQPDTTTTTQPDGDDGITACRDALQRVLDAQQLVSVTQSALTAAADELDAIRERLTAQPSGGAIETPVASGTSTAGPSSEDLVAYQAAVDAAELQVQVAQQAIKQATITSPIAGSVIALNLDPGDDIGAGSDTATIVVQGGGGYEATTTLGVDDLLDVELGDPATVTPDGGDEPIDGRIAAIGVAATSDGGATYPVIVSLDSQDAEGLRTGAVASVTLLTDAAVDTLAVPTSALHVEGGEYRVTVIDGNGEATDAPVEIGAVGDVYTEITSGLTAGQTVVLADISKPLPGSATDDSNRGQDNFPGRGGPGGGGPGGRLGPPAGFGPPG